MIARILWFAAIALVAIGTAGLQLDRQSGASPHLAALVPEPFRATAQARIVAASLSAAPPKTALAEAQRLVVRRPVPAQSLRLLALAQYKAGEAEQGVLSIQYAAQRGWRDIAAQEAMARLALTAGDGPEAARRFTALLIRAETEDETLRALGKALFGLPGDEARETLAGIIADDPRWHAALLRRGSQVLPPADFTSLVVEAAERGVSYDCKMLEIVTQRIGRENPRAGTRLGDLFESECGG